jgi:hypothetical protein
VSYPQLIFQMKPASSTSLIIGEIRLIESESQETRWPATSGIPRFQSDKHWWTRGKGLLPPSTAIRTPYVMLTELTHSDNLKAVGENLFTVWPLTTWNKRGEYKRTSLAVHLDANHAASPGSGGCIVLLNEFSWKDFCKKIGQWNRSGVKEMPLEVIYS